MKIIISPKGLKKTMDILDSDKITAVSIVGNKFSLHSGVQSISIMVSTTEEEFNRANLLDEKYTFNQENVRWDWIYKMVSVIEEQPMVIDFGNDKANLIFQY